MRVGYCQDPNAVFLDLVDHAVWETSRQAATGSARNLAPCGWILERSGYRGIDFLEELVAQPGLAILVMIDRLVQLTPGGGME